MNFSSYQFTPLEQYIRELYEHLAIRSPHQLDMIDIAAKLSVWLHFADIRSTAIGRNGAYSIIIDRRLTRQQQWQEFGHELGHVLRHAGNQMLLPPSLVQLQEAQATNFALHFCVPTFMLLELELPHTEKEIIYVLSETFGVEPLFAKRRWDRFKEQWESYRFYEALFGHMQVAEPVVAASGRDAESDLSLLHEYAVAHDGSLFIDGHLTDEEQREIIRYLQKMDRRNDPTA
ncbi:ImmA/IrrE family metallo-endopeptidase [Geobacillus zalihae]|uniref:ImmA/IrrE family metallo-endopeptidase n=1 Tax=Geobacillus zalihae TaxID=213419 RepID=UPI0009F865D7|nr:ImmA/IrrE family metallo-endopeptidase [Geobacillus zalihae]